MQQRGRPSDSLKSPYLHSRSAVGVAVASGGPRVVFNVAGQHEQKQQGGDE